MYSVQKIAEVVNGRFIQQSAVGSIIKQLCFDSRNISFAAESVFFALHTGMQDGHRFIEDAYRKGIRHFIVDQERNLPVLDNVSFIHVDNTLFALQQLASFHRRQFSIPVIGITGSNGKTIVKEWLYQLLHHDHIIARSPKSYNSQVGVPLSVWQIGTAHDLAIIEAGISQKSEMAVIEKIIQPTIGVFTNLGEAHSEGFGSIAEKKAEKLSLFKSAACVIGPEHLLAGSGLQSFTWGKENEALLQILKIETQGRKSVITTKYKGGELIFSTPFTDEASVENSLTCIAVMLYLGYDALIINKRLSQLHAVDMRLQLKHGINNCTIINDSYSADLTSLHIALHFMVQQPSSAKRTVILSDFVESGRTEENLYKEIANALQQNKIARVIAIGDQISKYLPSHLTRDIEYVSFETTNEFLQHFLFSRFQHETILVKGARRFEFERIAMLLEEKRHQTVLEINLSSIAHNLKQYRQLLQPATKIMAMVKAFAYGSGSAEIASALQFNKVDYLGVAYADEGIELRKAGISLPIMVMNADESSFAFLTEFNLQPVIYSSHLLHQFVRHVEAEGLNNYPVHIEVETGMNRLGFIENDIDQLGNILQSSGLLKVESVFSHLAASEDPLQDDFTIEQGNRFYRAVNLLRQYITYPFLQHIANSAAIIRHPQLQMDMVRLGIGMYGVEIETHVLDLQPVATFSSTIALVKELKAGDTVSYNRRGVLNDDALIATVRVGYADGYSRRLGNGAGKMWVRGKLVPVVGTVCMDMTMIDVSHVPGIKEGDEVILFGKDLPVEQVAAWAETIPYEIMTGVSQRVKRIYYQE